MSSILAPADLAPAPARGHEALARSITRAASAQTYATIRFLADRDRAADAYRAYAYFRWVDDRLDDGAAVPAERAAFLARQQALLNAGYAGRPLPADLAPEETLLAELIAADTEPDSGLRSYLHNMMAVMAFDVGRRGATRRGQFISAAELNGYTQTLATAVADALFHFIGHDEQPQRDAQRSLVVRGACTIHMLRDTYEDVALGYVNVPAEYLARHGLAGDDFDAPAYRQWVRDRVALARSYFREGREHIARLANARCRLAGYAYIARFEWLARAIERDQFRLRPAYPERKSAAALLWMAGRVLKSMQSAVSFSRSEHDR